MKRELIYTADLRATNGISLNDLTQILNEASALHQHGSTLPRVQITEDGRIKKVTIKKG